MRTRFLIQRGFTLIEVLVTMAVFVLLTASVFGIMSAVFESSNELKEDQNRKDELSALNAFFKDRFGSLAVGDILQTYQRQGGDGLRINGFILFSSGNARAFDISRQANGFYALRIASPKVDAGDITTLPTFAQQLDRNQSALEWTPLVQDIKAISWKFQSLSAPDWHEDWTQTSNKPAIIECSITLAGEDRSAVMDFAVPHLVAPPTQTAMINHAP